MTMTTKNFKDFRKDYIKNLKGKKFNVKEFNKAWAEYKNKNVPKIETPKVEKVEEIKTPEIETKTDSDFTVEKQSGDMIDSSNPIESIKTESESVKKAENIRNDTVSTDDSYVMVANSVHEAIYGIAKLVFPNVKVTDEQLKRLNDSGAKLLKKHDDGGMVEEYSPEMAYGLTILSIGVENYVTLSNEKPSEPK